MVSFEDGLSPFDLTGLPGLGGAPSAVCTWLLKQGHCGAILGPSLLLGGVHWFLPHLATFLAHLAPRCLVPKEKLVASVALWELPRKTEQQTQRRRGLEALALSPAQPCGLGSHVLHGFGNTFALRENAETVGKQKGHNRSQPAVGVWPANLSVFYLHV